MLQDTLVSTITKTTEGRCAYLPLNNGGKHDILDLLTFWKSNKYPLLALNDDGLHDYLDLPEFDVAREKEAAVFRSLRAEYVLVRDHWAQAGIDCMLIKSGGLVPSLPYLSDNLDVLVQEGDEERARRILLELGYIELKNIEEPQKFLFRKFIGDRSVSAIHLHTRVGWLVGFMDEKALWDRSHVSSDDEAVIIPSPEDTILITLAHSFYENKKFRLSDIDRVRKCWSRGGIDWDYMEGVAGQRGWLDGLHFCLLTMAHLEKVLWGNTAIPRQLQTKWKNSLINNNYIYKYYGKMIRRKPVMLPFTFSFFFSKLLYYRKIWDDRNDALKAKLFNIIQTLTIGLKLKSGIRPRPSLLVTFSGPDGSGKTELARALGQVLTISELKPRYYWKRCGTSFAVRAFSAIAKAITRSGSRHADTIPGAAGRKARLQNPLFRVFWSYLNAFDMMFSYLFQIGVPRLFGRIIICDRYVYDAAAEMACSIPSGDKVSRLAIKLMLASAPEPDAAFLLDIPEEICAQRKKDNIEPGYLRRQREVYLALADRYHMNITNSDRELPTTENEITTKVMVPYLSNFATLLNGLFLANSSQMNRPQRRGNK
jgi:thymidylate kinase